MAKLWRNCGVANSEIIITHGGVVPELWRTCGGIVAFFMPVLFFSLFSLCLFDIKASKWSKTGQKWVCRLARNTYKKLI